MSSRALVSPAALEDAGGGAFEVDGWTEVPDFFLGAMVDGAVEDKDGDEDDVRCTLSGSRKRSPYLACQRCRGISAATYGTRRPLAGSAGDDTLHKEQTSARQHDREHTSNLPTFEPPRGVRPYSCFSGLMVEWERRYAVHFARQGCRRAAATTRVWWCGFLNFPILPTGAMGLLL